MHTLQGIIPVPSRQVRIPDSLDRKVECLYTFCRFLIFPQISNLIKDNLHKDSDQSNPIRFEHLNHQLTPLLIIQQVVEYPLKVGQFSSLLIILQYTRSYPAKSMAHPIIIDNCTDITMRIFQPVIQKMRPGTRFSLFIIE